MPVQTIRDLGVLRCQVGQEAIKAVTEHLPSQYNKRQLDSKLARAAYIQALISDKQYPFIWEYFRPGNIPVGGAKLYYDDVSKIYDIRFLPAYHSVTRNAVDDSNQSLYSGHSLFIGLHTESASQSHHWTQVQEIAQLACWRWRQQR